MTAGSVVVPFIIPLRLPPPGKAKHEIDTNTSIEMKSGTPDVTIFYTLDGTKPELPQRAGLRDSSTLRYTEPIRLPSGKVQVKAMAVTSDGRQSAVLTRVFIVELVPSEDPEDQDYSLMTNEQSDVQQEQQNGVGDASTKYTESPAIGPRRSQKGRRSLAQGLHSTPAALLSKSTQSADRERLLENLTSTQISRIQRETDFLRCVKCSCPRPSDPFARFCLNCGAPAPPIPRQTVPPAEGGKMVLCVQCKNMVPANTSSCVVCEAPTAPQLQPQGKLACQSCGTGNPGHLTSCVTCESRLPQADSAVLRGQRAPALPCSEGNMVSCSKCSRVNHWDARFCDWCGAKPGHAAKSLTCSKCGANSHSYATYCGNCGIFLEGPPRMPTCTTEEVTLGPDKSVAASRAVCTDAQTQTVGLFYPSSAELQKRGQQREGKLSRQGQMTDRKPLLTAISPGRGFWRKQLDHICAHLRSYTQNNSEFRALVGEPRMGRLVSAFIEEDSYEVCLRVNFTLAAPDRSMTSPAGQMNGSTYEKQDLSAVTENGTMATTNLDATRA